MSAHVPVALEVAPLRAAARPLLESLPFPVLLIDADYAVSYRNTAAERAYGSAAGTCYQLTHGYSQPCDRSGELCPMEAATRKQAATTVCHAHARADRTVSLHKVVAVPLAGGGILECHIGLDELVGEDGLTGILGRGFFVRIVERELTLLQRLGMPYAFLVIDLDEFKSINDDYGHSVGDEVLRRSAATLKQSLRKSDAVGRWGGDEFVIFLPSVKRASAIALAERKAEAMRRLVVAANGDEVRPRASFGLYWSDRDYSLESAFRAADRALYSSKGAGGNQLTVSELS